MSDDSNALERYESIFQYWAEYFNINCKPNEATALIVALIRAFESEQIRTGDDDDQMGLRPRRLGIVNAADRV